MWTCKAFAAVAWLLAPELVDQPLRGDDRAGLLQQKGRQQRALLGRRQDDRSRRVERQQRAQHAEIHKTGATLPRAHRRGRQWSPLRRLWGRPQHGCGPRPPEQRHSQRRRAEHQRAAERIHGRGPVMLNNAPAVMNAAANEAFCTQSRSPNTRPLNRS